MFSSRTDWNLTPNPLSVLLAEKRKRGEPVIDLTESNPTRCAFSSNSEFFQALATDRSLLYEPDPHGLLSARESIAEHYRKSGIFLDPSDIFLTASTSEGYSHLFRLLCNPGDSVLIPKPSYPLFDYLCALNDVEVRHYKLSYDDEWHIDIDSINDAIDSSTRALLLVNPNNPTGSFVKKEEREMIFDLVGRRELALIVDEVFGSYSMEEGNENAKTLATERNALIFTLNGISKLLGLPQMKLAWLTVTGKPTVVHNAVDRLEIICDTYLSAGTPVQHALPLMLESGKDIADQIRKRVRANYRALRSMTARSPLSIFETEGGWTAIVQFPRIMSDEAWALRLLTESNVLTHPGHFFEIEQDACIVVSLLPQERTFSNGIGEILKRVQSTLKISP